MSKQLKIKLIVVLLLSNLLSTKAQFVSIANNVWNVTSLAVETNKQELYIGGNFTYIDTILAKGLGIYNMATQLIDSFPLGRSASFQVFALKKVGTNLLIGGILNYYDSLNNLQDNGLLVYDGNQINYPTNSFGHPPGYDNVIKSFETDSNSILMAGIIDRYSNNTNVFDIVQLPLTANYYTYSAFPKISNYLNDDLTSVKYYNGELYAGGNFTSTSGIQDLVKLDNGVWTQVGTPLSGMLTSVFYLETWNGLLLVAGNFQTVWGDPGDLIIAWDGNNWIPMGSLGQGRVVNMIEYKGELYIAGAFTLSTGINSLAKWDGVDWVAVDGSMINGQVNALATDGNNLFVGGQFNSINGTPCGQVLRYTKTVGLLENAVVSKKLKVYPNPAQPSSNVSVLCPNAWNDKDVISKFFNTSGQQLFEYKSKITQSKIRLTIPTNFPVGIYHIVVDGNNFRGSVSIVVN